MKQKLTELKREIDKPTFIVRDFSTSVSIIDRTTKQNLSLMFIYQTTEL